ncbi:unnamed protein product [Mesocestoides corti]|uniref:Uncharacterized protein n=1 Tax=Mesocestoides corti TaxID=53468 RepID=A0A0R3U335_MESCO|nr:unnamed protein product [Mesocestoides corti]
MAAPHTDLINYHAFQSSQTISMLADLNDHSAGSVHEVDAFRVPSIERATSHQLAILVVGNKHFRLPLECHSRSQFQPSGHTMELKNRMQQHHAASWISINVVKLQNYEIPRMFDISHRPSADGHCRLERTVRPRE